MGKSTLFMPFSLTEALGPAVVGEPEGMNARSKAWVSVRGSYRATNGGALAKIMAAAPRGARQVQVSPAVVVARPGLLPWLLPVRDPHL